MVRVLRWPVRPKGAVGMELVVVGLGLGSLGADTKATVPRGGDRCLESSGRPPGDTVVEVRTTPSEQSIGSREAALGADRADPVPARRDAFVVDDSGPVYLDGNSLGRQPRAAAARLAGVLDVWGRELIGGWDEWIELPARVGDRVGALIGAAPGQVVIGDSTTVNLYKLAHAALDARPGRTTIVADRHDFPTVRYVLEGVAAARGGRLDLVDSDPAEGLDPAAIAAAVDERVALVCLSGVNYRSGARLDLGGAAAAAHGAGALVLWDLSHAAGSVPVALDDDGADLAVGCGYKYLNGGPGAPAWLYVRRQLQEGLRQPIWGWWGQEDPFAMGDGYRPAPGMARFLSGTPAVIGLAGLDAGLEEIEAVGVPALWSRTGRLMTLLADRVERRLVPLGATLACPAAPDRRAGHLSVAHPYAWALCRLAVQRRLVVGDFRPPDVLRLAPVPLYTRFVDVWDAVEHLAAVLADPAVAQPLPRRAVT
jgi:kynureninase